MYVTLLSVKTLNPKIAPGLADVSVILHHGEGAAHFKKVWARCDIGAVTTVVSLKLIKDMKLEDKLSPTKLTLTGIGWKMEIKGEIKLRLLANYEVYEAMFNQ